MPDWSYSQQVALAVTPKFSSVFSLAGSSWIMLEVLSSEQKRHHPYHRLLLAMSFYDGLESIWNFLSTWPMPSSDDGEAPVWAVGTTQTCTAQGFFLTLSVAVPIYNAFLALYYMLVINHNVRDRTLRRVVEPAMHLAAATWAFGTALAATGLHLLHDANLWCWIAPAPCPDDDDDDSCREDQDEIFIFRWVFYFGPLWFCILVATICTFRVYKRVNSLDRRTLKFRRPAAERIDRLGRRSSRVVFDGSDNDSSFNSSFSDINNAKMSLSRGSKLAVNIISTSNDSRHHQRGDSVTLRSDGDNSTFDLMAQEQKDDIFLSGHADDDDDDDDDDERNGSPAMNILARWKTHRSIYREDYPRSVEVMHQAICYLGAFYLTHLWSTSNRIVQALNGGSTFFPLILLHAWFDPFQGALNFAVYQRPRYLKIRKFCPELTRWEACRKAFLFSYLPPPSIPTHEPRRRREAFASAAADSHSSLGRQRYPDIASAAADSHSSLGRRRYPDNDVRSNSMPSIVEGMVGADDASCKSGQLEESSRQEIAVIGETEDNGNDYFASSEQEKGNGLNTNDSSAIDNDYGMSEHRPETEGLTTNVTDTCIDGERYEI